MTHVASLSVTPTLPIEGQFDESNPAHLAMLQRYFDAKAILTVKAAGYEVENAEEAWAIIRTNNVMADMQTSFGSNTKH